MTFYEYTAFYQDGKTVHHLSFVAGVNGILSAKRVRGLCYKALCQRVQTGALLLHWVVEIPAADVSGIAIYPAADMQAIYNITTT